MKEKRLAISLIFNNADGRILIVKRSHLKPTYPGFWSLPSTYLHGDESPQEAANRLVKKKLGLRVVQIEEKPLGESTRELEDFVLHMADHLVVSVDGDIQLNDEEYTEKQWLTKDELKQIICDEQGGEMGQCCEVLLNTK